MDHYHAIWAGVPLCLAESADTLVRNLAEIQPTHMSSVPRFYEKVLTAVTSPTPEETARRLRGVFGPRLDWLGSGGAPLPPAIAHAFHDAGVAAGGKSIEDPPGWREGAAGKLYLAYLRDPYGNKICALHRG